MFEEGGVHYFEDGHYWIEVEGIADSDSDSEPEVPVKVNRKVKFSNCPMKVSLY